jgi:hypothetical protein
MWDVKRSLVRDIVKSEAMFLADWYFKCTGLEYS